MNKKKNPAQEYLLQVKLYDRHIDNKLEDLAHLRALTRKITSAWGTEPTGGTHNQDKLGDAIAKIIDMEKEINAAVDRFVEKKNEVLLLLEKVRDADQLDLLYKVYFRYETLEQVACEMNMSYRNACYIHGRALQTVEALLAIRGNNDD